MILFINDIYYKSYLFNQSRLIVKKIYILLIFAIFLTNCGGGGSGSSGDRDYRITPGSLTTFDSPGGTVDTEFLVDYGGASTGNYSVIFNQTINGTDYVGIAVSDNPAAESFNMKIYFPGSSIPSGAKTITTGGDTVIKVYDGSGPYTSTDSQTINLTFTSSEVIETHGDSDSSNDTTYTIYRIQSADTIGFDGTGSQITAMDIHALRVGSGS